MRTLFLLRHAKSSLGSASQDDFDRPLNEPGKDAANIIGEHLRTKKVSPQLVLSSPALRARETVEIILGSAELQIDPLYDDRIYEASLSQLLAVLGEIDEGTSTVLLVGHNPGMAELLSYLTGESREMATAALAEISLGDSGWQELRERIGSLDSITKPGDLR